MNSSIEEGELGSDSGERPLLKIKEKKEKNCKILIQISISQRSRLLPGRGAKEQQQQQEEEEEEEEEVNPPMLPLAVREEKWRGEFLIPNECRGLQEAGDEVIHLEIHFFSLLLLLSLPLLVSHSLFSFLRGRSTGLRCDRLSNYEN